MLPDLLVKEARLKKGWSPSCKHIHEFNPWWIIESTLVWREKLTWEVWLQVYLFVLLLSLPKWRKLLSAATEDASRSWNYRQWTFDARLIAILLAYILILCQTQDPSKWQLRIRRRLLKHYTELQTLLSMLLSPIDRILHSSQSKIISTNEIVQCPPSNFPNIQFHSHCAHINHTATLDDTFALRLWSTLADCLDFLRLIKSSCTKRRDMKALISRLERIVCFLVDVVGNGVSMSWRLLWLWRNDLLEKVLEGKLQEWLASGLSNRVRIALIMLYWYLSRPRNEWRMLTTVFLKPIRNSWILDTLYHFISILRLSKDLILL